MELGDAIGGLMRGRRIVQGLLGLLLGTAAHAGSAGVELLGSGLRLHRSRTSRLPAALGARRIAACCALEARYNYEGLDDGSVGAGTTSAGVRPSRIDAHRDARRGSRARPAGSRPVTGCRSMAASSGSPARASTFRLRAIAPDSFFYKLVGAHDLTRETGCRAGLVLQKLARTRVPGGPARVPRRASASAERSIAGSPVQSRRRPAVLGWSPLSASSSEPA
jgi:hypothetical protein